MIKIYQEDMVMFNLKTMNLWKKFEENKELELDDRIIRVNKNISSTSSRFKSFPNH